MRIKKGERGMTLIEIVMAMFVFALVGVVLSVVMIQSQKIAQSNIIRNLAHSYVQGYLEQIRAISNQNLRGVIENANVSGSNVITLTNLDAGTGNQTTDNLVIGVANSRNLLLNLPSGMGNTVVTISMTITPNLEDMNVGGFGSEAMPAVSITLDFTYRTVHLLGGVMQSGTLKLLKADES